MTEKCGICSLTFALEDQIIEKTDMGLVHVDCVFQKMDIKLQNNKEVKE